MFFTVLINYWEEYGLKKKIEFLSVFPICSWKVFTMD